MPLKTGAIVGKTNGANSSEHKLTVVALLLIGAATTIAATLGVISPEQASEWTDLLTAFVLSVAAIVGAYAHGRSKIKASIAAAVEDPAEETIYVADDATIQALEEGKVGIVPGSKKIERVAPR